MRLLSGHCTLPCLAWPLAPRRAGKGGQGRSPAGYTVLGDALGACYNTTYRTRICRPSQACREECPLLAALCVIVPFANVTTAGRRGKGSPHQGG